MGRLTEILQLAQERPKNLGLPYVGALTPREAAEVLELAPGARIVDVRTRAEWDWVGRVPGALEIEWSIYPDNEPNPYFIQQLKKAATPHSVLLFICRSGVRSSAAAAAASNAGFADCYNVLEGFEGEKNAHNQRSSVNGWRKAGLPWYQG